MNMAPSVRADDNTSWFEVRYEDGLVMNYQGCGRCVATLSTGEPTVSIVMYDKAGLTYWALVITQNYDGTRKVQLTFVDRNPNIPQHLRGSYATMADVTSQFELTAFELKSGGRIAGKLHLVRIKNIHGGARAEFAGSFDLKLPR